MPRLAPLPVDGREQLPLPAGRWRPPQPLVGAKHDGVIWQPDGAPNTRLGGDVDDGRHRAAPERHRPELAVGDESDRLPVWRQEWRLRSFRTKNRFWCHAIQRVSIQLLHASSEPSGEDNSPAIGRGSEFDSGPFHDLEVSRKLKRESGDRSRDRACPLPHRQARQQRGGHTDERELAGPPPPGRPAHTGTVRVTRWRLECTLHCQPHVADVTGPLLLVFLQAALEVGHDRRTKSVREHGPLGVRLDDAGHDLGHVVAVEQTAAGQHLEQDHTECPDVRPFVRRLALGLFRRHIRRRPQDHAHLRGRGCQRRRLTRISLRCRVERLGQPEVQDLDGPVLPHLDVGGLEIAVNHAGLMRRLQRLEICLAIGSASSSGIGPCAIRSARIGPSTNSKTSACVSSLFSMP